MEMLKSRRPRVLALTVAVLVLWGIPAVRAADDEADLRARALKLNELTGEDTVRGQIVILLDDPPGSKKLLAVAAKMAKSDAMTKESDQPFNLNATYVLATVARGLKDMKTSEKFYRLNIEQAKKLESGQKLVQAYLGLTGLFYENKKYEESERLCKEFVEYAEIKRDSFLKSRQAEFLERMILALAKQGRTEEATKLANSLIKRYKGHWLAVEILGRIQHEAGQPEEAAKTYEKVLDAVKKEKGIKEDELKYYTHRYRYILSGIYMDLDQVDKATEQLKALLAEEPDNPTYNNDLGYIWADHDMNLDESEKMVRKALEQDRKQRRKENPELKPEEDKDNPAYLDSLGWVLFKQKKVKEAKPYLLRAVEDEEGRHIEIYDHLGEVHMALGEKAEAVAAWKKGIEVAGKSKREQHKKLEVEKKLKAQE